MQNPITIWPEAKTQNPEITQELAFPAYEELKEKNINLFHWNYQDLAPEEKILHTLLLEVPSNMPLSQFFAIMKESLDWNDAEYKCLGLKPLEDNQWAFTFTFEY